MFHSTLTLWRTNDSTTQSKLHALLVLYLWHQHLTPVRSAELTVTDCQRLTVSGFLIFFCLMFFTICFRRSSYIARKHCHLGHAAKELRLHTEGSAVHACSCTLENAQEAVWSSSLRHVFDFKTPSFWRLSQWSPISCCCLDPLLQTC